jgi:sulfopyruvate decarboxylase TPP-binding subunit
MSVPYTPNPPGGPSASALETALRRQGVTHVVTVPDFVQFALHDRLARPEVGIDTVYTCTEDQALTVATGLHIGGATPVVLMQNQGFYKAMNTLRATAIDAGVPMVLLVGQFAREPENFGQPMSASRRSMVRFMEPVVEAFGLRHWTVDEDTDVAHMADAFAHARSAETAAVVLIGRHVTWN